MQTDGEEVENKMERRTEWQQKTETLNSKKMLEYVVAFSVKESYDDLRTSSVISNERKILDIMMTPNSSKNSIKLATEKNLSVGSFPECKNEIKIDIDFDDLDESVEKDANNNLDIKELVVKDIEITISNDSNKDNKNRSLPLNNSVIEESNVNVLNQENRSYLLEEPLKKVDHDTNERNIKDPEVLFDSKQSKRHKPGKRKTRNHFTALKIKNIHPRNKITKKIQKYCSNKLSTSAEIQKNFYDTCITNVVSRYQVVKNALAKENLLESDIIEFYTDEDRSLTSSASTVPTIKNVFSQNTILNQSKNSSSTGDTLSNNSVIEIIQGSKSPPYKSDVINVTVALSLPQRQKYHNIFLEKLAPISDETMTLTSTMQPIDICESGLTSMLDSNHKIGKYNLTNIKEKCDNVNMNVMQNMISDLTTTLTSSEQPIDTSATDLTSKSKSTDNINRGNLTNFDDKGSDVTITVTQDATSDITMTLTSSEQPMDTCAADLTSNPESTEKIADENLIFYNENDSNVTLTMIQKTLNNVPSEKLDIKKSSSDSSKKHTNGSSTAYCISSCTDFYIEDVTAVNSIQDTMSFGKGNFADNFNPIVTSIKATEEKVPLRITNYCQTLCVNADTLLSGTVETTTMTSGDGTFEKKVFKSSEIQNNVRKKKQADSGEVPRQKIYLPDEAILRALLNEKTGLPTSKEPIYPEPSEIWDRVTIVLDVITQRLERNLTAKIIDEIKSLTYYCNQQSSFQSVADSDIKAKHFDNKSLEEDKSFQCSLLGNETLDDLMLRLSMEPKLISTPKVIKEPDLYQEIEVLKPPILKTAPLEEVVTEESLTASAITAGPAPRKQNKYYLVIPKLVGSVYLFMKDNLFVIVSIPTFFILVFLLYIGVALLFKVL